MHVGLKLFIISPTILQPRYCHCNPQSLLFVIFEVCSDRVARQSKNQLCIPFFLFAKDYFYLLCFFGLSLAYKFTQAPLCCFTVKQLLLNINLVVSSFASGMCNWQSKLQRQHRPSALKFMLVISHTPRSWLFI